MHKGFKTYRKKERLSSSCARLHMRRAATARLHFFEERVRDNQSRPSYKPSPVVAQADWMYHCRWRRLCKPSFSVTSAAVIAFGKSCLFAKTNSTASRISSSFTH